MSNSFSEAQTVDQVYDQITTKVVKRTVQPTWRGSLPYLNQMAPAPTYENLSQAALYLAANWTGDTGGIDRSASPGSDDLDSLQIINQEDSALSGSLEQQDSEVDPLPMSLPDITHQGGGQTAGTKGSMVSLAALPAFFRDSPTPDQLISAETTFETAELLGKGVSKDELTGMQWFNSTGLVRMQELWEVHSQEVDLSGKNFAEALEALHAATLHAIAQVKNFNLKMVLMILKQYTDQVREMTLETYRNVRRKDDDFSNALYHGVKLHFEKGLRSALEGSEKRHREKLRNVQERHQNVMDNMRDSSKMTLQHQTTNLKTSLVRQYEVEKSSVREELTKKLNYANLSTDKLKASEDLLKQEVTMLKQDFKQLKAEHRVMQGFRSKYDKEHTKHEKLKKEAAEERDRNLKYITAIRTQMEEAVTKRDEIINRSRDTIFRLEAELMTLRESPGHTPQSRTSNRSNGSSVRSSRGDPGRRKAAEGAVPSGTPPLLGTSHSHNLLPVGVNGEDGPIQDSEPRKEATFSDVQSGWPQAPLGQEMMPQDPAMRHSGTPPSSSPPLHGLQAEYSANGSRLAHASVDSLPPAPGGGKRTKSPGKKTKTPTKRTTDSHSPQRASRKTISR